MAGIIPLISSDIAGPLGVIHLPRLWSKVLLSAKGQLADGYDECGKGFDLFVGFDTHSEMSCCFDEPLRKSLSKQQKESYVKTNKTIRWSSMDWGLIGRQH